LYDTAPYPGTTARRAAFTYTDNVVAGDWCCEYQKNTAANSQNDSAVAVALTTPYDLYLVIDPTNTYWLIGSNNAVPAQVFKTATANISATLPAFSRLRFPAKPRALQRWRPANIIWTSNVGIQPAFGQRF
jgi:hypothetical protein